MSELNKALEEFADHFTKALRIMHMQEAAFAVCEHCRNGCEFTDKNRRAHFVTNSNGVTYINLCKSAEIYKLTKEEHAD